MTLLFGYFNVTIDGFELSILRCARGWTNGWQLFGINFGAEDYARVWVREVEICGRRFGRRVYSGRLGEDFSDVLSYRRWTAFVSWYFRTCRVLWEGWRTVHRHRE